MSSSTSVFIAGSPMDEVVSLLAAFIGKPLQRSGEDPTRYQANVLEIKVVAFEGHGLEDDRGIPFSHYPCEVSFVRYASSDDADLLKQLCQLLARLFARNVAANATAECLIVDDLQRLVERVCPPGAVSAH